LLSIKLGIENPIRFIRMPINSSQYGVNYFEIRILGSASAGFNLLISKLNKLVALIPKRA
jgi:hypothetical protein